MNEYTLCVYSATSMEIASLSQGVSCYREDGGRLKVLARTRNQLGDETRTHTFIQTALASDVVVIILHGGRDSCPALAPLIRALEEKRSQGEKTPHFHIQPSAGDDDALDFAREHSDGFATELWNTIYAYLSYGGAANHKNLLAYLHNHVFHCNGPVESPCRLPQQGIYHPDFAGTPDLETYLEARIDPQRITVGLWFYQAYWVNNNLLSIDAMIREIERQGANVIPVFHMRHKDVALGNQGADHIVENFFMNKGRPRIDVLINPLMFSLTLVAPEYKDLFPRLDVPIIQVVCSMSSHQVWKASAQGLPAMDVTYSAAQPEFDGALITVPVATREEDATDALTGALLSRLVPIPERVKKAVALSLNWARLHKKDNSEKRIAIIFHHYPPRNDRIGCAAGLDSFESVKLLLDRMRETGYRIDRTFENGVALAREMLQAMTCDRRWLTPERMAERAEAQAGAEHYELWHDALPPAIKEKMTADWGKVPGDLFVHDHRMYFPGIINGNVFLTIQPPRGYLENIDRIYHDMHLSPPHHYLAYYRWIRDVFGADAVMHVGKHGSLEWLPGKAVGLSEECYPDLAIMDLPNVYPYIINDPSEGTQAKRRSYCCIIDHLTPVFTNADLYEDLAQVENLIRDYEEARNQDSDKLAILQTLLWEAVVEADLDKDLDIREAEACKDFERLLEALHAYLTDLADTMVSDGLHVMGVAPEGERLVEFLVQLTRLANGEIPSLRESILRSMGYDLDDLLENKGRARARYGNKTGGEIIREAHALALTLVRQLAAESFDPERSRSMPASHPAAHHPDVALVLSYISASLVPRIRRVGDELEASLRAFDGRFVLPGPSGAPSRGQADILPTGRNFYSVDPAMIPSPAAWEVGKKLGDALIRRYWDETGRYPESIGIILWGGPTMRSKGDDVAEILYLLGVRPVWRKGSGKVAGVEVIPLSELGRPRLDVVPRISGFFRDAFPNLVELIDQAVQLVALFEEPPENNLLRGHVLADEETYRKEGLSKEDAFREATFRIFGCPPGSYGAGVAELVEARNWKTRDELGSNAIRYSAHAYGQGSYGRQKPAVFRKLLRRMDVTVKNEDSREYDMLSCTDYYNYYGGLIAAVKTVRGELPHSYLGDGSDPRRIKIRSTSEEARQVLRARLLNPKWLEGLKRHGYKGAGDISKMMDVVLGWDATAEVIEDWMYERLARKYALDAKMQEWLKEVNPHALQNILDKLLEAINRGMWSAEAEMEQALRDAYLDIEGEIEELTE